MNRSDGWGRVLAVGLLAVTLALAPLPARAAGDDPGPMDGWGNVWGYSLCAAGVAAGAVSLNINVVIGSMIYCRQLYREAV